MKKFILWTIIFMCLICVNNSSYAQASEEDAGFNEPQTIIEIPLSGSKLFKGKDIYRVVVGFKGLVEVTGISNRELLLTGLAEGVTTFHVWDAYGVRGYMLKVVNKGLGKGISDDEKTKLLDGISKLDTQQTGKKMEIIKPQYRSVAELASFISQLLSEEGEILFVDEKGEQIFLVETPENLEKIKKILKVIDVPTKNELYNKIIYLKSRAATELEPKVKDFLTENGKLVVDEESNSILVIDTIDATNKIEKYLMEVDQPTVSQVQIEAKFVEMTDEASDKLGLSTWSATAKTPNNTTLTTTFPGDEGTFATLTGTQSEVKNFKISNFAATLKALETQNLIKVISSPTVVTRNQQKAELKITREITYIESYTSAYDDLGNLSSVTPNIATVEDGIWLTVTPVIGKDDIIQLDVVPELKEVEIVSIPIVIENNNLTIGQPTTRTRKATLNVAVKNNEVLVIGGLKRTNNTVNSNKVPKLHKLPVIGNLFKYKDKTSDLTDITIFVKSSIIDMASK